MGGMSYYCWHHPWGEYVGRRNYKPLSFYVSGRNVLLTCMRWVLAIIEDYMMVEYVDLPKGSYTRPFLKRWWIVVAKLTENIVCWFLIEFMLYTSTVWWIVTYSLEVYDKSSMIKVLCLNLFAIIIIYMMILCPYFVFINTSLSKHVDMFFDFGFRLRTSEVYAWGRWYVHFASCLPTIIYVVYCIIKLFGVILMPFLS